MEVAQLALQTKIVRLSYSDGSEITNLTVPMVPPYLTQADQIVRWTLPSRRTR